MPTVPFFQAGLAIQSLRESDFDSNSAYGEVVDNALQAYAENIHIRFDVAPGKKHADIQAVAFGDDGTGMDARTLHNCLTIGWSSRYNDRDGIGRFGVGMTLAAIHECKRIEVWSKESGGEWLHTYLDLDEIETASLKDVPEPVHKKLPKEFSDLPGKEKGTLVVWRKHDRQQDSSQKIIEEFTVWCGRTYRYFIWAAVPPRSTPAVITINGSTVPAVDPLYVQTDKTRFPEDPKAQLYPEMIIQWPVDYTAPGFSEGLTSTVRLRMSKLPEQWRPRQGSGGDPEARKRFIDLNEGVSILRSQREVFYGHIPYWKSGQDGWPAFEDIDRWWGCEILFTPEIDRAFQVKNIKRGAVPTLFLKKAIKDQIRPTRNSILEEVRALWKRTRQADREAQEAEEGEKLLERAGEHDIAESTAKKAPVPRSQLDAGKDAAVEAHKAAEAYSKKYDAEQRKRLEELFKSQPFTIMEENWPGQQFYESKFLGGNAVLDYNMSHAFWETVYGLVDGLTEDDVDAVESAREIRVMLDLLIIAHAKAEAMFSPEAELTADQFTQFIRSHWGQYLTSYVNARSKENQE